MDKSSEFMLKVHLNTYLFNCPMPQDRTSLINFEQDVIPTCGVFWTRTVRAVWWIFSNYQ